MAKNNRYMGGMELLTKVSEFKKKKESDIQKFGRGLRDNYVNFRKAYDAGKLPYYAGYNPFRKY